MLNVFTQLIFKEQVFFLEISRYSFKFLIPLKKKKKRTERNKSCPVLACLNLASDKRLQPLSELKWLTARGRPQLVPAAWQVTALTQTLRESPPHPVNGSSTAAVKISWASKDLFLFPASPKGSTCSGQQRGQQKAGRALSRRRGNSN